MWQTTDSLAPLAPCSTRTKHQPELNMDGRFRGPFERETLMLNRELWVKNVQRTESSVSWCYEGQVSSTCSSTTVMITRTWGQTSRPAALCRLWARFRRHRFSLLQQVKQDFIKNINQYHKSTNCPSGSCLKDDSDRKLWSEEITGEQFTTFQIILDAVYECLMYNADLTPGEKKDGQLPWCLRGLVLVLM